MFVLIDHDARTIRIRQSWLDTAIRCPERGRQAIIRPHLDGEGDAACAGTAAHAAIEAHLKGELPVELMEQYAQEWARKMIDEGVVHDDGIVYPIEFKSFESASELIYHAGNCTRGWIQDIRPHLIASDQFEGQQEVRFEFEAFEMNDYGLPWLVIFQGTVDHVPEHVRRLWDWKNKGSDMKQKELQRTDIQKIVYSAAAVNGCFGHEFEWPVRFAWGNNVRLKTKARSQIVEAEVLQAHWDWLTRRTRTIINLFLNFGLAQEWPTDEDHFLCSQKWCPWYADCRGAHITADMDRFGYSG